MVGTLVDKLKNNVVFAENLFSANHLKTRGFFWSLSFRVTTKNKVTRVIAHKFPCSVQIWELFLQLIYAKSGTAA